MAVGGKSAEALDDFRQPLHILKTLDVNAIVGRRDIPSLAQKGCKAALYFACNPSALGGAQRRVALEPLFSRGRALVMAVDEVRVRMLGFKVEPSQRRQCARLWV